MTTTRMRLWQGQAPVWIGLAMMVAASWVYLARLQAGMSAMAGGMAHDAMAMAGPAPAEFVLTFVMWGAMMMAMMVPTAVPALALYLGLAQQRWPARSPALPASLFVGGYVAVWLGYSAAATAAQMALSRAALLTPMLASASAALSAAILLAAGLFQFTPVKDACLAKCRTPLAFLLAEWRDGAAGTFMLGLRHGGYCVACCWALMALLFVAGAMNLLWMAALAALMLGEKIAPARWRVNWISGVALILWAGWIAAISWR